MNLIVSVTSYKVRLNTLLPLVIDSILKQDGINNFKIIVYLAQEDYAILNKEDNPLIEYKIVPDYKSYKKYIALTEREFDDSFIWIIDDDIIYKVDNYNLFKQSYNDTKSVYAFGVQYLEKRPFFFNDFEHDGNVLKNNYLLYSGCGCFYPPYVSRFNISTIEDGCKVSPYNDDAFISAFLIKNKISVTGIKIKKRNFYELPKPFFEETLIDKNFRLFDLQILKCFNYFNLPSPV